MVSLNCFLKVKACLQLAATTINSGLNYSIGYVIALSVTTVFRLANIGIFKLPLNFKLPSSSTIANPSFYPSKTIPITTVGFPSLLKGPLFN